jgi:hypothetical protein
MIAQLVTDEAVVLLLPEGGACTPEEARAAVAMSLATAGLTPWSGFHVELYPSHGGTLIMARPAGTVREAMLFRDLEELLAALPSCPESISSALYSVDGQYLLELLRHEDSDWTDRNEFCIEYADPRLAIHAAEHGKVLIPRMAVELLRKIFK